MANNQPTPAYIGASWAVFLSVRLRFWWGFGMPR